MTERDEIDVLAGEYVLGTLDGAERAAAQAQRRRDPALEAAILTWEGRLAPLADWVPSVSVPKDLLARIEAKLPGADHAAQIVVLEHYIRRWRRVAIAGAALAACLLLALSGRELSRPQVSGTYVAVFQKDDASPAFLLSVDFATRVLSVRPVLAEPPPGKSYQLWIASDQSGGAPQSLGLIEAKGASTQRALVEYDRASVERATFGISLEPVGGSPTGRPTGPAFHAKLIKTSR
jgi:anti-sigma-K factor RskA